MHLTIRYSILLAAALVVTLPLGAADKKKPALPESALELKKWSADLNVPDAVAVTVDPNGVIYATQSTRRKVADLDIREHPQWIASDVALEDIDQKQAFFHDVLAPGKYRRPEGELADHNKDGSIDWKDLTVHTERIWRLEDTDGDGIADKRTVFAEGFNTEVTGIAAGVLWHDGWVYATITPDLWRLRDTNGDGVADEREIVVHGFGHHIAYAGHDMHGLIVGPDGRIYWTIGDKGVNVHTKDGRHVAYPHEGCIMRCEPDGSGFEVYAHGLRNLQQVAFNEYGEIFGVDNDADKPGERERVVNVAERSDSGWRNYYQYMKGWQPWMDEGLWKARFTGQPNYITPPMANDYDGPAGFAYNPGTALSAKWRGWFFLNQFPKGKMAAMRFAPDGATYKMTESKVVTAGVMGIEMAWAPDGKLLMADWGGGYPIDQIGAVYTVDDPTGTGSTERKETAAFIHDGMAKREVGELSSLLAHADMRVRQSAQFELAKRAQTDALQAVALDEKQTQLARIHALWGLGQILRAGKADVEAARKVVTALKKEKDAEVRAQLVKVIGDSASCAALGTEFIPWLNDKNVRVRFQTAIALGKLKTSSATDALLKLAAANNDADAYVRHAVVTGLEGCANPARLGSKVNDPSRAVRLASVLALRRQSSPSAAAFLQDRDPDIATEAARAIHDDTSIDAALPALAAMVDVKRTLPDPLIRRALNAAFRLGDAANAGRVINFAMREDADATLRAFAFTLALSWTKPQPLDIVDGRARKLAERDPAIIAQAVAPHVDAVMALPVPALKTQGIRLIAANQLPVAAKLAAEAIADQNAPREVRVEILRMLGRQHPESAELAQTLDTVLASAKSPETLRMAALDVLLPKDKARATKEAARFLNTGGVAEKQHAIATLAAAGTEEADAVLAAKMDALIAGGLTPALQLELIDAVRARAEAAPALREKLEAFERPRAALGMTPAAFSECLEGGNASAGKLVVQENLAANCLACHKFEKRDTSNVGPSLEKIATERDRAYLLEALVAPQAKIAPGFGMITVVLKKGETVIGNLLEATDKTINVRLADGKTTKIPVGDIASKTEPISVMPPMGTILDRHQIRDVVAYLSTLKGSPAKKAKSEH